MNSVALIGRIGQAPELRYTPTGTAMCKFSLAVDGRKGQDGQKETHWINCVAWQKTAELVNEHCGKGKQIGVNGRLSVNQWETQEGQKRKDVEVIVDQITFCGPAQGQAQEAQPKQQQTASGGGWGGSAHSEDIGMDDVPF